MLRPKEATNEKHTHKKRTHTSKETQERSAYVRVSEKRKRGKRAKRLTTHEEEKY